ncbi:hypothetical protein AXW83_19865 [Bosea sp. PAMC 26642]|nr:hypothetical protein AXW83_19865 [Bosea sp. PAMC 26642]
MPLAWITARLVGGCGSLRESNVAWLQGEAALRQGKSRQDGADQKPAFGTRHEIRFRFSDGHQRVCVLNPA